MHLHKAIAFPTCVHSKSAPSVQDPADLTNHHAGASQNTSSFRVRINSTSPIGISCLLSARSIKPILFHDASTSSASRTSSRCTSPGALESALSYSSPLGRPDRLQSLTERLKHTVRKRLAFFVCLVVGVPVGYLSEGLNVGQVLPERYQRAPCMRDELEKKKGERRTFALPTISSTGLVGGSFSAASCSVLSCLSTSPSIRRNIGSVSCASSQWGLDGSITICAPRTYSCSHAPTQGRPRGCQPRRCCRATL